jgi:SAM-dependent methyltransferase
VHPVEQAHGRLVRGRRAEVLSARIAELLPPDASVLDIGCGDGAIAALVLGRRPDLEIEGIDVLVRDDAAIPVQVFGGTTIPRLDRSVDAALLVDVLHHADDPDALLAEAVRVSRTCVVVKDHLADGFAAGPTLRFMDRVGNRRFGVSLPYGYRRRSEWDESFRRLPVTVTSWSERLRLYPAPASALFDRSLHFLARLDVEARR